MICPYSSSGWLLQWKVLKSFCQSSRIEVCNVWLTIADNNIIRVHVSTISSPVYVSIALFILLANKKPQLVPVTVMATFFHNPAGRLLTLLRNNSPDAYLYTVLYKPALHTMSDPMLRVVALVSRFKVE